MSKSMKGRYLEYLIPCTLKQWKADETRLFTALDAVGFSSSRWERDQGGMVLHFGFDCGCETCPHPETVKQARRLVSRQLRKLGVGWTYRGSRRWGA